MSAVALRLTTTSGVPCEKQARHKVRDPATGLRFRRDHLLRSVADARVGTLSQRPGLPCHRWRSVMSDAAERLFGLPAFRDPMDPATVYVFHQKPILDWHGPTNWLRLYDDDLPAFKVQFRAQDIPPRPYVTAFDLTGGEGPDEGRVRDAVDWRLNWYRDPRSAWWEQ